MIWRTLETFNYDSESARQHTIFPGAWVTDGKRVTYAEQWSEGEWKRVVDAGEYGAVPLDIAATHWMAKPDPPGA